MARPSFTLDPQLESRLYADATLYIQLLREYITYIVLRRTKELAHHLLDRSIFRMLVAPITIEGPSGKKIKLQRKDFEIKLLTLSDLKEGSALERLKVLKGFFEPDGEDEESDFSITVTIEEDHDAMLLALNLQIAFIKTEMNADTFWKLFQEALGQYDQELQLANTELFTNLHPEASGRHNSAKTPTPPAEGTP